MIRLNINPAGDSQCRSGTETSHRAGNRLWKRGLCGAIALAVVAGIAQISIQPAAADPTGLEIVPLAQGFSTENHIRLQARGPNDVLQARLVFQAGGDTGWHIHPGPVVVVVKSGALTEYHSDGSITVHPQGSVFFESAGEVHRAVNQTGAVTEVYATFISPAGSPPLQPVPDPTTGCQR
jgi:quercetin dioxygenase-like cupin family protein